MGRESESNEHQPLPPRASSSESSGGARPPILPIPTPAANTTAPSLAAALSSSIHHHARLIDGPPRPPPLTTRGGVLVRAVYDDDDDDNVSLSPTVELGFEREARLAIREQQPDPVLIDFVANPERTKSPPERGIPREDSAMRGSWVRGGDRSPDAKNREKSVRFATPPDPSRWVRSSFVAPPPTSFRGATRHPSHYMGSGAYYDRDRMRHFSPSSSSLTRAFTRKRPFINDSLLRFILFVLCFGLSFTFVFFFGDGKLGMAMSSTAYQLKMGGEHPNEVAFDPNNVFYPVWWQEESSIPDMTSRHVELMGVMEYNVADVVTPRAPGRVETPFLWLIPKSGGNVVRTALSACLRLVEASDLGGGSDPKVLAVQENNQQRFVNVDMFSLEGLDRAKALNLASSGVPDVVISNRLHDTLQVFNHYNRARLFAVFRHPLERAVSKYYSELISDPAVAGFTLPQYIRSGESRVENNYLTRLLSGEKSGRLNIHHLDIAREFLRRKVVVGLTKDLPTSLLVFNDIFQWNHTVDGNQITMSVDECNANIFHALSDKTPPAIEEGSEGWKLLVAQNWFDLKVYEYIEYLFGEQLKYLDIISPLAQ